MRVNHPSGHIEMTQVVMTGPYSCQQLPSPSFQEWFNSPPPPLPVTLLQHNLTSFSATGNSQTSIWLSPVRYCSVSRRYLHTRCHPIHLHATSEKKELMIATSSWSLLIQIRHPGSPALPFLQSSERGLHSNFWITSPKSFRVFLGKSCSQNEFSSNLEHSLSVPT